MEDGPVVLAGCRRTNEAAPDDLYPDPDAASLQSALQALGLPSVLRAWDDPTVEWAGFSRVVVSSTWDSVDRADEFLGWVREVAARTTLVNGVAVIEWGMDKRHQQELEVAGVPVIPTQWLEPGTPWEPSPTVELVVKPSISAGGRSTARYAPGDRACVDHVQALHRSGHTVMVQEYLPSIDNEGETDLIFFAGAFSHAVKKLPLLKVGGGLQERPWEQMAWDGLVNPGPDALAVAVQTLDVIAHRFGYQPAYGRVDLVNGPDGSPLMLEVELIDPYLSLDIFPAGAARLAEAVLLAPPLEHRSPRQPGAGNRRQQG